VHEHGKPTITKFKTQREEKGGVNHHHQQQKWSNRVERGKRGCQSPSPSIVKA